ncbi:DedA family protein [Streptomyces sp. NBC_01262]|uniref:DedA family protein n=1 Tax=Streptomyces sp. NBC_01262 TaxID=2903803 RepID=UPI002E36300D|nr:VTT domain-containing protein [Streptomyces sp. NBC_01262]
MLEGLGSLLHGPWIYPLVAVSIVLDVFLPVLPSGMLLISAATAGSATAGGELIDIAILLACAASASILGDIAAYRLAWRGGDWLDQHLAQSRRLSTAQERLGAVLAHGGGALVVLARFAPAGRSVVSLSAGAAHRRAKEFLPWSALAGLTWAVYSVGLGYLGGQWLGATWLGTGLSLLALIASGSVAAYVFQRERNSTRGVPSTVVAVNLPAQATADRAAVAEAL